eukprot:GHVS01095531.1.p1 GENE.GHVS01095531.1~~GHVS01095531.1.p1  ORF type:complete len:317 (-),score=142.40 GHVS01095531.1:385-1227(-)
MVAISAVDMDSGTARIWTEQPQQQPQQRQHDSSITPADGGGLLDALMAATAVPGIFPAVLIGGRYFNDASVNRVVEVEGAVNRCMDSGRAVTKAQVQIDIVLCSPPSPEQLPSSTPQQQRQQQGQQQQGQQQQGQQQQGQQQHQQGRHLQGQQQRHQQQRQRQQGQVAGVSPSMNSIEMLMKAGTVRSDAIAAAQLKALAVDFPDVSFRFLVRPSEGFHGSTLDFNAQQLGQMIERGKEDGRQAVTAWRKKRKEEVEVMGMEQQEEEGKGEEEEEEEVEI